jgi:pyruvate formate lyase activating enzyme
MLQYRKVPPPIVASTLLVPGYIDVQEVKKISEFIAKIDPDIPYSLLAFHPDFFMEDMGFTSKQLAEQCYSEAKKAGLRNVKIGNVHLLI